MKNTRSRSGSLSKSKTCVIVVAGVACFSGPDLRATNLSGGSDVSGDFTVGTTTDKGKLVVDAPQSSASDLAVLGLRVNSGGGVFFAGTNLADPSYTPAINSGFYFSATDKAIQLGNFSPNANGWASISSGYYSVASGGESIAVGYQNVASASDSAAFGSQTVASGAASAAFGNSTDATASNSFSAGDYSLASGVSSFAAGTGVTANALSSAAFGAFNKVPTASATAWVDGDPLFTIGNGTADNQRSSALMVQKDGIVNLYPFGSTNASIVLNPKGTTPSITVGGQKVLTADSSGYVSIGARNPTVATDRKAIELNAGGYGAPAANNTASNGDKLILYRDTAASYDATIGVGSDSDMWFKSSSTTGSGKFKWYTGSSVTNSMVLDGNGNLGIGTPLPEARLDVKGTAVVDGGTGNSYHTIKGGNLESFLNFSNTAMAANNRYWRAGIRANLGTGGSFIIEKMSDSGASVANSIFTINSGGNVGIGTTNPLWHFVVGAGTGTEAIAINGGTGNAEGAGVVILQNGVAIGSLGNAARLIGGGTSQAFRMQAQNSNNIEIVTYSANPILLGTGNAERMRIDASGNVGVGTASPTAKFEVAGTVKFAKQGDIPMGEFGTNGD